MPAPPSPPRPVHWRHPQARRGTRNACPAWLTSRSATPVLRPSHCCRHLDELLTEWARGGGAGSARSICHFTNNEPRNGPAARRLLWHAHNVRDACRAAWCRGALVRTANPTFNARGISAQATRLFGGALPGPNACGIRSRRASRTTSGIPNRPGSTRSWPNPTGLASRTTRGIPNPQRFRDNKPSRGAFPSDARASRSATEPAGRSAGG